MLVIKLGGRTFETPEGRDRLLAEVAAANLDEPVVLVHGGGHRISAQLAAQEVAPRFENGLRVTDDATMRVVESVLTLIGKEIACALTRAGAQAVAVTGRDAALVQAEPRAGLGLVGRVTDVSVRLLEDLVHTGYVPVVAPIAWGPDGAPLNVNADEVAGALARALGADLLLLTDVDAVRGPEGDVTHLDAPAAARLLDEGHADGGMRPKLQAALDAATGGGRVVIANGNRPGVVAAALAGATGTTVTHRHVQNGTTAAVSASFSPST